MNFSLFSKLQEISMILPKQGDVIVIHPSCQNWLGLTLGIRSCNEIVPAKVLSHHASNKLQELDPQYVVVSDINSLSSLRGGPLYCRQDKF